METSRQGRPERDLVVGAGDRTHHRIRAVGSHRQVGGDVVRQPEDLGKGMVVLAGEVLGRLVDLAGDCDERGLLHVRLALRLLRRTVILHTLLCGGWVAISGLWLS